MKEFIVGKYSRKICFACINAHRNAFFLIEMLSIMIKIYPETMMVGEGEYRLHNNE
jgi:hypothetical protein